MLLTLLRMLLNVSTDLFVSDLVCNFSQMIISNLTANMIYEVKVRGASRSVVEHSKLYKGPYSEPKKIFLQSKY